MRSKGEAVGITSGETPEPAKFLLFRKQLNQLTHVGETKTLEEAEELASTHSDGKHVVYVVPLAFVYDPNRSD